MLLGDDATPSFASTQASLWGLMETQLRYSVLQWHYTPDADLDPNSPYLGAVGWFVRRLWEGDDMRTTESSAPLDNDWSLYPSRRLQHALCCAQNPPSQAACLSLHDTLQQGWLGWPTTTLH